MKFVLYIFLFTYILHSCWFGNNVYLEKAMVNLGLSVQERSHKASTKHNSVLERAHVDIHKRMDNLDSQNSALKMTLQNIQASAKNIGNQEPV